MAHAKTPFSVVYITRTGREAVLDVDASGGAAISLATALCVAGTARRAVVYERTGADSVRRVVAFNRIGTEPTCGVWAISQEEGA